MTSDDRLGPDHLSKAEIRKDALQDGVEATATAVGSVTTILTAAVRDVARAVGGLATDLFEIRDATRRAREAAGEPAAASGPEPDSGQDTGPSSGRGTGQGR